MTARPSSEVSGGLWFAQGYATEDGRYDRANEFAQGEEGRRLVEEKPPSRGHPAKVLLGVVGGILEGEILRSDDKLKYALKAFEKAVKAEDKIDYDEPEPLPFSARHWLGAALLDLERPQDAERVYREDLKKHPHNGWSLFGLKQALAAQGKPTAEVDQEDLAASWARANVTLTSTRDRPDTKSIRGSISPSASGPNFFPSPRARTSPRRRRLRR